MFTSRAEYRLQLREDNADLRLTAIGREFGLVDDRHWDAFGRKRDTLAAEQARLQAVWLQPDRVNESDAERVLGQPLRREQSLASLLCRPEVTYAALMTLASAGPGSTDPAVVEQIEIQARYGGYIDRQQEDIERSRRHEDLDLPPDLDFRQVRGLSNEVVQKLSEYRPRTLGQAARVAGVTPAAISLLLVYLKKQRHFDRSA
jgi:tRNA uridine 5-carboxymethylaminomethyl modification enzyme